MNDDIKIPDRISSNIKKIKNLLLWILFVISVLGGYFILSSAFKEDKHYADLTAKYYLPAVQDYRARHYQEAIQTLKALLHLYPEDYPANFEMGLVLRDLNRKKEARVYFLNAQNIFLTYHGRFSSWERYDAAQREINKIDHPKR